MCWSKHLTPGTQLSAENKCICLIYHESKVLQEIQNVAYNTATTDMWTN